MFKDGTLLSRMAAVLEFSIRFSPLADGAHSTENHSVY